MAQHSKPINWLNALAANARITRDRNLNPQALDPVPKRSARLRALTGLLSFMGGLTVSCMALPSHAETARVYIVEVLSTSEDVLEVVRTAVSDAYIVTKDDGTQSIIAGTFVDEANARRQATELHALDVSPTSISPFEYTPEDEAILADGSAVDNADEFVASSNSTANPQPEQPVSEASTPGPASPEPATSQPQPVATAPQTSPSTAAGGGSSIEPGSSARQYSTLVPIPNGTEPEATLAEVQHFFPDASLQAYNQGQAVETGTFSHRSQAQLQADWLQTKGLHAISVPAGPLESNSAPAPTSPTTASAPPTAAPPPTNQVPVAETAHQPETATPASAPASVNTGTTASTPASPIAPPADALASVAPPASSQPETTAVNAPAATSTPAANPVPQSEPPAEAAPVAAAPPVDSAAYWVLIADPVGEQLSDIQAIVPTAEAALYNQQQVVRTGEFATEAEALEQVRYLSTQGYEAGIFNADEAGQ
ncbi:MAG: hypothetical protein AAGE92_04565 [Cyanobacteria bacterium P01_G01_bin.4]